MGKKNTRQLVFLLREADGLGKSVIGGKGFGLVEMTKLGLPVPPAFVIVTGTSRAFLEEGSLPKRLEWQLRRGIADLEKQTGRKFGGRERPLLVSVRSGAKVSMPGMMDTILNLGLNQTSRKGFADMVGETQEAKVQGLFEESFRKATGAAEIPEDPWTQLRLAIAAVCRSWESPRAVAYRKANGIRENDGTAIVVQAMVFGNVSRESGTGVVFSRDVKTGLGGFFPFGEYLPNAQGEELVSGRRTPQLVTDLAVGNPAVWAQLENYLRILEKHYNDVVEVEFTVEWSKLWILQVRVAKRTPLAAVRIAVDFVCEGSWTKAEAVRWAGGEATLRKIPRSSFSSETIARANAANQFTGLAVSAGVATGYAVFHPDLAIQMAKQGNPVILIREDTSPDDFTAMQAARAIVTLNGGDTCHAAVVARALGKPAVVVGDASIFPFEGGDLCLKRNSGGGIPIVEGNPISVDGNRGLVFFGKYLPEEERVGDDKIITFTGWVDGAKARPEVSFRLARRQFCVNELLNDNYLAQSVARALGKTKHAVEAETLADRIARRTAEIFSVYLALACASELRHLYSYSDAEQIFPSVVQRIEFLLGGMKFNDDHRPSEEVIQALEGNSGSLREYAYLATVIFREGYWLGSTFGGESWARIAEALFDYLEGKVSAGLFVDRVFDLRHNGGRLFDKHPMVSSLTDEDSLAQQLDWKKQARGLQNLACGLTGRWRVSPEVIELYKLTGADLPSTMRGF